jgi:two-component system phosphate regulon sensor histidine kinase PhoR
MQTKKHNWILYLITATIITTIAVQVYWNYKNFEQNKQHVSNEIQLSFNTAIEEYFASLAKASFLTINGTQTIDTILNGRMVHNQKNVFEWDSDNPKQMDSVFLKAEKRLKDQFTHINDDSNISIKQITGKGFKFKSQGIKTKVKMLRGEYASDSLNFLTNLNNIYISIQRDSIEYLKIDSLLQKQLAQKKIELNYVVTHYKQGSLFYKTSSINTNNFLSTNSKSTFVRMDESLRLWYQNPFKEALNRSLSGIFLSLLLSLAIISCLFYLLHIINKQKELAEIKNDLISNITHEFKTPITTVSAAIEAIRSFNTINDQEKTEKYLSISTSQLKKLTIMVEKLLETATLDSEQLLLKKENIDIIALVQKVALKEEFSTAKKNITFNTSVKEVSVNIDSFHFENAISNLIDNAIKYGGNNIEAHISTVLNTLEISVVDDGKPIEKNQREKIFDQFYRIPKGNTHDVKGFGIGLYYTKKIIEKHGGQISLIPNTAYTIFKISMPL